MSARIIIFIEYEQVLKIVELDDYIKNLSNGIDTLLGRLNETGTDLSGGQWQRIAVARSLIRKAPVLIVDEPTASLDPTGICDQVYRG